jgi:hypothetical protein
MFSYESAEEGPEGRAGPSLGRDLSEYGLGELIVIASQLGHGATTEKAR